MYVYIWYISVYLAVNLIYFLKALQPVSTSGRRPCTQAHIPFLWVFGCNHVPDIYSPRMSVDLIDLGDTFHTHVATYNVKLTSVGVWVKEFDVTTVALV